MAKTTFYLYRELCPINFNIMKIINYRLLYIVLSLIICHTFISCATDKKEFVVVYNGQFRVNGKPYYFIGTNFWYGAILGSQGQGGERDRLLRELDYLKSKGIDNLRVLIGADGMDGTPTKVMPTLQKEPGVYNDSIFDGLDFLLAEMGKRKMYAVLYFTNSWEWSGGYSQYLEWTGHGPASIPSKDGWETYINYVSQYASCEECTELLKKHITNVITRTNHYTGEKYINDPTIFSWQICNEPHAFGEKNKDSFEAWMKEIASHIRSLDPNHLISSGSEGIAGSEFDAALYERIHTESEIDYFTLHIWPLNWGWLDARNMEQELPNSIERTNQYIEEHIALGRKHRMPVVVEEFGLPRNGRLYNLESSTSCRDTYFENIFKQIIQHSKDGDVLAGCNFWAWGGFGRATPGHTYWQAWDDYLGDPAQEEQGLNAVFNVDKTVSLIDEYTHLLGNGKP